MALQHMKNSRKLLLLPGDGIGPEVVREVRLLNGLIKISRWILKLMKN